MCLVPAVFLTWAVTMLASETLSARHPHSHLQAVSLHRLTAAKQQKETVIKPARSLVDVCSHHARGHCDKSALQNPIICTVAPARCPESERCETAFCAVSIRRLPSQQTGWVDDEAALSGHVTRVRVPLVPVTKCKFWQAALASCLELTPHPEKAQTLVWACNLEPMFTDYIPYTN